MIKIKAKRRSLVKNVPISIPFESTTMFVTVVVITIFLGFSLAFLGLKSLKLKENNRWLSERIEQKRIEVQHLKDNISEILSEFEIVKVNEK